MLISDNESDNDSCATKEGDAMNENQCSVCHRGLTIDAVDEPPVKCYRHKISSCVR